MCRPTTCRRCSKATWAGCGQHVNQVMRHVTADQRCTCTSADRSAAREARQGDSWFARLLRR